MQQTDNLAPHVNEIARALQNRMEPDAIEDELRRYLDYGVPLAQAKRDIVRMHGGTLVAGERTVASLVPEEKGVELKAKVLTVNPKEITVKGQPKTIYYGFVADATGKVSYTAWKDFNLQRGIVYKFKNAYAKKGFRDPVELNLGDFAQALATDEQMDVKDDFGGADAAPGASGGGTGRMAMERKVRDLRDGQGGVTLVARVLDARQKTLSTANGPKTIVEGELADETGQVAFSAWEPEKLPATFVKDAVVRVRGGYVRAFRGTPQLNFGQYAQVDVLPAASLPSREELMQSKPITLAELEAAGGGQGFVVEGVVLEVKKGSGLISRCPQEACNRVLQKGECRIHGKQPKPVYDLRIKAVIDDGHGAATFFAGREATEKVLGKSLAQAQEQARDAMTVDVIQDELVAKLTARRVAVHGGASSDEYGLTLNANELEFVTDKPVQAEAEKLLGSLMEVMQEVSP